MFIEMPKIRSNGVLRTCGKPGSFTADSTIIQGTLVKDSIKYGEIDKIEITE